jgi:hypothetical protein
MQFHKYRSFKLLLQSQYLRVSHLSKVKSIWIFDVGWITNIYPPTWFYSKFVKFRHLDESHSDWFFFSFFTCADLIDSAYFKFFFHLTEKSSKFIIFLITVLISKCLFLLKLTYLNLIVSGLSHYLDLVWLPFRTKKIQAPRCSCLLQSYKQPRLPWQTYVVLCFLLPEYQLCNISWYWLYNAWVLRLSNRLLLCYRLFEMNPSYYWYVIYIAS